MNFLISVIIPAYNEQDRLQATLETILAYFKNRSAPAEIIVVDDHSSDATGEVARAFWRYHQLGDEMQIYRNQRNLGKGFSIKQGMQLARGAFALMTDADLSTPIEEIEKLEREVIDGSFDVALGSRDIEGSVVEIHQSWFREQSGKIFNRLVRAITGLPFRDTQCGFKLFKLSTCKPLFQVQTVKGFGFDVELLYVARKWGLSMKEVPVVWRHAPGSKVHFATDAPLMFLDLLRIRWNDRCGRYERESAGRGAG
ncbi:MAG TPA: glycosyltransferase family 2 protein [Acidobacteriota bacterium]|nr:glycosyltransferase family 2 protein [Acidobacteriota bacterium]